ncbi:MAG TPA: TIGR03435 family protein [Vicinamibacterales bacterium]|nr:TIGR03435 family protein [Vicinamibacterales bacterium]
MLRLAAALALLLGQAAPTFEVASVKPNPAFDAQESVTFEPGGGIRMTGYRLINLILGAYELRAIQQRDQIIGGPAWLYTDRFDIVAKAEGTLTFDAQGRRPAEALKMLKSLIEDRFAVKVHTETRMMRAFALALARKDGRLGPRLVESATECARNDAAAATAAAQSADRWCGFRHVSGRVEGRYVTMSEVSSYFAADQAIKRPIEDRTHLNGRYDFTVEYADAPGADAGSLFTAFREQLGLKFDNVRTQVPVLVIDHAEHPTPD